MASFPALPAYMDWHWLWLAVASFLAGVLNAVAGGGSFLAFPAMMGMPGILPVQANATNTVALWPGQLTSIAAYWADIRKNRRLLVPMCSAGLLGGTAGALVLLNTPQMTFLHLVPWLLLTAASIFAISGPVSRWLARRSGRKQGTAHIRKLPLFFTVMAVCFYIGYFGAGAGFLIITVLSLFGCEDLHEINGLKVATTTLANGVAFLLFVVSGRVVWHYCLLAMVMSGAGGYMSARFARLVPQSFLRGLVVAIGLGMAAWFFLEKRLSMANPWWVEALGLAAGTCTTISLFPQAVRIYRTKSAGDLSLLMFTIFGLGLIMWLSYGIFTHSLSVIVANSVSLAAVITILALAVRYRGRQNNPREAR